MTRLTDLNTPWTLTFERNGTEDAAIIFDAAGDELVRSQDFWPPAGDDAIPAKLAVVLLMHASPVLLAACQLILARWAHGDLAEAARVCRDAVALATSFPIDDEEFQ